jgi:hypothetical protein
MQRWLFVLMLTGWLSFAANAAPLALDIEGNIANTNDPDHTVYHLTEAELTNMPAHSITTSTTWTPRSTFTGPLLGDLLKLAGARGERVEVRTLDDYSYTVSVSEALKYGAILAYSMNGTRLKASDFGPLFLIYPRDAYPEQFSGAAADAKFAWQIKALILK